MSVQKGEIKLAEVIKVGGVGGVLGYLNEHEMEVLEEGFALDGKSRPAEILKELTQNPGLIPGVTPQILDRLRVLEARILSLEVKKQEKRRTSKGNSNDPIFNISQEIILKERAIEQLLMEISDAKHLRREDVVWAGEILGNKLDVRAYLKGRAFLKIAKASEKLMQLNEKRDAKQPKLFYVKLKETAQELVSGPEKVNEKLSNFENLLKDEKLFQRYLKNPASFFSPLEIIALAESEEGADLGDLPDEIKGRAQALAGEAAYIVEAHASFNKYQVARNAAEKTKYHAGMINAGVMVKNIHLLGLEINRELDAHFDDDALARQRYVRAAKADPETFVKGQLNKIEEILSITQKDDKDFPKVLKAVEDYERMPIFLSEMIEFVKEQKAVLSEKTESQLYALEAQYCCVKFGWTEDEDERKRYYKRIILAASAVKDMSFLNPETCEELCKPEVISLLTHELGEDAVDKVLARVQAKKELKKEVKSSVATLPSAMFNAPKSVPSLPKKQESGHWPLEVASLQPAPVTTEFSLSAGPEKPKAGAGIL